MPALLVKRPSVAPTDMVGTTGTPGQIRPAIWRIGSRIAGLSGGGGEVGSGAPSGVMVMAGLFRTRAISAWVSSIVWPGKMRQLTLAVTRWGWALGAWPPLIRVGMQVVRRVAFHTGLAAERRAAAAASGVSVAVRARRSAAYCG